MNDNFIKNQTRWTPEMTQKLAVLEAKLVEELDSRHFYDIGHAAGLTAEGESMGREKAGTLSTVLRARGWSKFGQEVMHSRYGELVMANRWAPPGLKVVLAPAA